MRVCFFSHYFPPEGNAPASRTYENLRAWRQDGVDTTVVTCAPNSPHGEVYPGYRNRLYQRETIDGIRVVRVWTYMAPNKGTLRRILNFVSYMLTATATSLFLRRPHVVIATSPQFFCGWAGLISSKVRRVPFILEVRDLWPDTITAIGAMKNETLLSFVERLERWMYAGATHIVTVGEGYKQKLVEKGVPPEKISVVTNGVDFNLFQRQPPSDELRRRHQLDSKFVCASCGTLGLCSGLEVVPAAAKILRDRGRDDILFLLVGDGAIRNELDQAIADHNLSNVVITGMRKKEEIPDYLSVADVCLSHLQRKTLFTTVIPSKIFEAMGMAKPIILGVEGVAADIVSRAEAGLCIEPDNPTALADAVETFAADAELRQRCGEAGFQYALAHFDRQKLAAQYLAIIRQFARVRRD